MTSIVIPKKCFAKGVLKPGHLYLAHGHEFHELKDVEWETCLVFFDGYKSCYHGFRKFLIYGDRLETFSGRTICKGFSASPFGQDYADD